MSGLDPITVEVVRNKLESIANEMQLTLVRSAFSAIVKEGLDASASLFTLQGETLAQALAIPVHLGALTPMVGQMLRNVPLDSMRDVGQPASGAQRDRSGPRTAGDSVGPAGSAARLAWKR